MCEKHLIQGSSQRLTPLGERTPPSKCELSPSPSARVGRLFPSILCILSLYPIQPPFFFVVVELVRLFFDQPSVCVYVYVHA